MVLRHIVQKIFLICQASVLLPVVCLLLAGFTLLVYGAVQTVTTISLAIVVGNVSSKEAKIMILSFIEIIDVFLLATVFYITALGLYELFVDNRIRVPTWLEIRSIDDLKNKLASVVVVILGVVFLGQAVRWESGREILPFGLSVALVIATLTYFLGEKTKSEQMKKLLSSKGTKNLIYSNSENQVEVTNNKDRD
ncbi:YqhA family protein [Scytonema sp. NUACC26]|uniref:YqhA family protein n=1 Tax=Scytonema sp. NUACC26 TaxID=3140176 RepID=UPI0034DC54C7